MTRREFMLGAGAAIATDVVARPIRSSIGGRESSHTRPTFPPSVDCYVQDSLIAIWDGIENIGYREHAAISDGWSDLIGNISFHVDASHVDASLSFGDNCLETSPGMVLTTPLSPFGDFYPTTATFEFVYEVDSNNGVGSLGFCLFADGRHSTSALFTGIAKSGRDYMAVQSYLNTPQCVVRNVGGTSLKTLSYAAFVTEGSERTSYVAKNGESLISASQVFSATLRRCYGLVIGGGTGNWADLFQGKIHCIRVYNRPLTNDEIALNYSVDIGRFSL